MKKQTYLRVKNWKEWQHYKDREPPWVKLHSKLLRDSGFLELSEQEQWQLVRIWLVFPLASRFTLDEEGRVVPVVAYDETTMRRAIGSLKRVPLRAFVESGWLIEVAESDLVEKPPTTPAGASAVLAQKLAARKPGDSSGASTLLEAEKQRSRGSEKASTDRPSALPESLPIENEFLCTKLLALIGDHADEGTPNVIHSYAKKLAPAALARVAESTERNRPDDRAAYIVRALRNELREANAA